jgi:hypothetical protein
MEVGPVLPDRTLRLAATRATCVAVSCSQMAGNHESCVVQCGLWYELKFGFAERPFRQNGPTDATSLSRSCLPSRTSRLAATRATRVAVSDSRMAGNHESCVVQCGLRYELRFGFAERPFRQNGPTDATRQVGPACRAGLRGLPRPERRGLQ